MKTKRLPTIFAYGYSHAVRIGPKPKGSGVVGMDNEGNLTAPGDLRQQMINCYADLDTILKHYGYSWDDVVVENILTTDMQKFEARGGLPHRNLQKAVPDGFVVRREGIGSARSVD